MKENPIPKNLNPITPQSSESVGYYHIVREAHLTWKISIFRNILKKSEVKTGDYRLFTQI